MLSIRQYLMGMNNGKKLRKISLYSTYYDTGFQKRQQELDYCLINNLQNAYFNDINIFIKETDIHLLNSTIDKLESIYKKKLNIIILNRIPTYKDWIQISKHKSRTILVFANADIYFDSSIGNSFEVLKTNDNCIICLAKHDVLATEILPARYPHWSQDAWILHTKNINNIDFIDELNISTGLPRCDNKFAYIFTINGWNLYNPFLQIKCYHKHTSKIRNYHNKNKSIYGATAFVHPTYDNQPSNIDICIFPKKLNKIQKTYISPFLYD